MNSSLPDTAILIPVFNKLEYTRKCLESLDNLIFKQGLSDHFSVVLIDDGSNDGTSQFVSSAYTYVHIIEGDGNLWWSGGINAGAVYAKEHLKCSFILLWNNDILCDNNYFIRLVEVQNELTGNEIVGSKIYMDHDYRFIWSAGGYYNNRTGAVGMYGYNKADSPVYDNLDNIQWLAGMGTLIPVSAVDKIGLWDAVNYPQYKGDLEFTYRAYLNGYKLTIDSKLKISNDTRNSSLNHEADLKKLIKLFTDLRSLYNFKINWKFTQTYGKGPLKYSYLIKTYTILIISYIKHVITDRKP